MKLNVERAWPTKNCWRLLPEPGGQYLPYEGLLDSRLRTDLANCTLLSQSIDFRLRQSDATQDFIRVFAERRSQAADGTWCLRQLRRDADLFDLPVLRILHLNDHVSSLDLWVLL